MSDIIHLLPDVVANQIAAGEVIQRPASAVKELLENAVDAGANHIQLIIKDSGKTLIQIVDNGKGMSFNDSRICFERHATSKITTADDLFHITTKGFRGEALASIAAIAHVELKTKQAAETTGTLLLIEGSEVKEHSPIATQDGTSISIKNLFFNVPARRNFLKSDAIEFGHIEEEFYRVALIHTDIAFSLTHNGKCIMQLPVSNFKQRIINIFGNHFKDKLFPIEQVTDQVEISGFIAKPENAKKKKSEQYMFINNRYVRHNLLNYAIETAYSELIPDGYKPAYFIRLAVDPATIDINISPTKVDVKLQDERLIFGFLNSTVKKSIGQLSLTPRLDFDYEKSLDFDNLPPAKGPVSPPPLTYNPSFNPFTSNSGNSSSGHSHGNSAHKPTGQSEGWEQFLQGIKNTTVDLPSRINQTASIDFTEQETVDNTTFLEAESFPFFNIENRYLIFKMGEQLALVHLNHARERILYEKYLDALQNQPIVIQQSLFPETITLSAGNIDIFNEIKEELHKLGYDLEPIGKTQFAVNGTPNNEEDEDIQNTIDHLIESYKSNSFLHRNTKENCIALSLAKQKRSSWKSPQTEIEVKEFIKQLLSCQIPYSTPSGKKTIHTLGCNDIEHFFR